MRALERNALIVQQPVDDLQLLAEPRDTLARGAELEAVCLVLASLPPCTQAERDSTARDLVDRGRRAREHGGMTESGGRDERSELEPRRAGRESRERRPCVEDVTALVEPGDVVVRPEERLDSVFLAG